MLKCQQSVLRISTVIGQLWLYMHVDMSVKKVTVSRPFSIKYTYSLPGLL